MVDIADIKEDLPEWPDDVIHQWLLYFANEPDCGWPPPEPLEGHRWAGILGGRSLSWWKKVSWKKETVTCDTVKLSNKTRDIVQGMIAEIGAGTADAVTRRRFDQSFHFILNNAAFPKPILAMKVPSGLEVVDGNHRMSAFCALQIMPDAKFAELKLTKAAADQEAWIGTHSDGEAPVT
jgi:hypothetical protein